MENWINVIDESDIEKLQNEYHGFHDTCISSYYFECGNCTTDDGTMMFSEPKQYELHIFFQGQWKPRKIELCFTGVRRFHFVGLQDNYLPDIFDSYIAFHEDILPHGHMASKRVIVWADWADFRIDNISNELEEPATTYVIADSLKWRKMEE